MAKALMVANRLEEALVRFREAQEYAPKPLLPPASEEMPRLIAECEALLGEEDNLSGI